MKLKCLPGVKKEDYGISMHFIWFSFTILFSSCSLSIDTVIMSSRITNRQVDEKLRVSNLTDAAQFKSFWAKFWGKSEFYTIKKNKIRIKRKYACAHSLLYFTGISAWPWLAKP